MKDNAIKTVVAVIFICSLILGILSACLGDGNSSMRSVLLIGIMAMALSFIGVLIAMFANDVDSVKRTENDNSLFCDGEHEAGEKIKKYEHHTIEDVLIQEDENESIV